MRFIGRLLALIGILAIIYFGFTAYIGYRMGTAIHSAEQRRIVRVGAHLAGRSTVERYAIRRSGLPDFLVESPTFWLLLRNTE
ncbi:MAG: hypothetical protein ACREMP_09215 [Candidatus Tyrphobacter sp.]